jgi:hypothetical protein
MLKAPALRQFILIGFSLFALQVSAAEVTCPKVGKDDFESGFKAIRDLAITTNSKLCQSMLTIDVDHEQLFRATMLDYSAKVQKLIYQSFDEQVFTDIGQQFNQFELRITDLKGDFNDASLERLQVDGVIDTALYFDLSEPRGKIGAILDRQCKEVAGSKKAYSGCKAAFQDMASGFNAYRDAYNEYRYGKNEKQLSVLSSQWDKFLTEARGQTLLDVLATTWMHRDYYAQTRLVAPASTQYFLLRPQVVYEYIEGAPKGDKQNLALALEWAGINWWNNKIPFGISVISVYSDQANQDSVANGFLFTLNNKYSFGVTKRGDHTAIFITLDLVKLMQDKNEQLERYKSMF